MAIHITVEIAHAHKHGTASARMGKSLPKSTLVNSDGRRSSLECKRREVKSVFVSGMPTAKVPSKVEGRIRLRLKSWVNLETDDDNFLQWLLNKIVIALSLGQIHIRRGAGTCLSFHNFRR